jgi:TolA-binding protein
LHGSGRRAQAPGIPFDYRAARDWRKRIEKSIFMRHNDRALDNWMNIKVKLTAYAVLLILAVWFGWGFYSYYSVVTAAATESATEAVTEAASPGTPAAPNPDSNRPPSTNVVTNAVEAVTNAVEEATNTAGGTTNIASVVAGSSNNPATPTNAPATKKARHRPVVPRTVEEERVRMIRYLAALIGALIGLGVLVAIDATHFLGSQATNYLFHDVADAARDPAFERAEAEWTNGHYLEAVQMMREFLKENPRELYAALRIAEIYEKDLRNYLAAALEYEEVLKCKLPPERWGWAAIHLCNLYSKLGQPPKAAALLHRIVEEYPRTGAAKKARVRLGIQELVEETPQEPVEKMEAVVEETEEAPVRIDAPTEETPPPPPSSEPPKSNLPPGFWKK